MLYLSRLSGKVIRICLCQFVIVSILLMLARKRKLVTPACRRSTTSWRGATQSASRTTLPRSPGSRFPPSTGSAPPPRYHPLRQLPEAAQGVQGLGGG